MIIESKRKYAAGLRGCMGVPTYFSRLLGLAIGGVTYLPGSSETEVLEALQGIGPEDTFILFSLARYYEVDMLLIDMIKEYKGRICAVTGSLTAPMIRCADISFVVGTSHMSFFDSTIGTDTIAECIITLACRKNKEEYRLRARKKDIMTEGFRLMQ